MAYVVNRRWLPAVKQVLLDHKIKAGTPGPLSAAEIARRVGYGGINLSHETARRRIREMIVVLREEEGMRICASDGKPDECGYWLARDDAEWHDYLEAR